jgi:hypothetical protein
VTFAVTDIGTGKPINNATVTIDGRRWQSSGHGMVVARNVAPGSHVYVAAANRYLPATATFSVTSSTTINVQLSPAPKVVRNHERED